jgi:hypothetical protein
MSRLRVIVMLLLTTACSSKEAPPAQDMPSGSARPTPPSVADAATPIADAMNLGAAADMALMTDAAMPATTDSTTVSATPPGFDFTPVAKDLIAVASCGGGTVPEGFPVDRIERHCEAVRKTQADYAKKWVEPARAFFASSVPADIPKKVVYPFAGGDLSTALTVFPDADEITTLSLEPAGDPRTLEVLRKKPGALRQNVTKFKVDPTGKPWKPDPKDKPPGLSKQDTSPAPADIEPIEKTPSMIQGKVGLDRALATIQYELHFLYVVNFSNTMNMIDAMRTGQLPTQLVFGLSALHVHGFEVVSLRYFKLAEDGAIEYLSDADIAKAPEPTQGSADLRNRIFANAEIRFRKPGGRIQIYRHLQVNLDNAHMKKDPRTLKHLEAKGPIAGMTKAASYLLSWPEFSTIRTYLVDHVVWMVSDATGVPPKFGKPAGFTYETYGAFTKAHINGGNQIAKDWRDEFAAQEKRSLKFRFGYYDGSDGHTNHLAIMSKKPPPK